MYSAGDLPKEGLPHSDIRGSTIARISPRLFAACHVLHRLLAPRHPPNALVSLTIKTPIRPHAVPNRAQTSSVQDSKPYAHSHSTQPFPDSPVKDLPARARSKTRRHLRRFWKHASLEARRPRDTSIGFNNACRGSAATCRHACACWHLASSPSGDFPCSRATGKMEANGFEPMTPCLQSRCSTS